MSSFKGGLEGPRRILGAWPLLAGVAVTLLNIDLVVIPLLLKGGISGFRLFFLASILSTVELTFWYWFWGWLIRRIIGAKSIRESIDFGKEMGSELRREGYTDRIKNFFVRKFYWAISRKNRIARIMRTGGALSMVLIGAFPEPGTRIIGIIFCRTARWKNGFYFLALGNILHLGYIIGGWNFLFSLLKK